MWYYFLILFSPDLVDKVDWFNRYYSLLANTLSGLDITSENIGLELVHLFTTRDSEGWWLMKVPETTKFD